MVVTLVIIAITCLVSFLAFNNPRLLERLILWPPAVSRHGQYDRLLGYGLIHADGMHLLFNMITLYFFGAATESLYTRHLGPLGFALFYVGGLLVSVLPSYFEHKNDANYRSLGASGAVSAVLFAFILLQPWARIYVYVIPVPAIIYAALYVGYSIYAEHKRADNINHSAHLWGAAYGIAFTGLMEPSVLGAFVRQLANPTFGR
jgi:membrane associated rhomboid family serine protease